MSMQPMGADETAGTVRVARAASFLSDEETAFVVSAGSATTRSFGIHQDTPVSKTLWCFRAVLKILSLHLSISERYPVGGYRE